MKLNHQNKKDPDNNDTVLFDKDGSPSRTPRVRPINKKEIVELPAKALGHKTKIEKTDINASTMVDRFEIQLAPKDVNEVQRKDETPSVEDQKQDESFHMSLIVNQIFSDDFAPSTQ